jgi:hypothetical protein
MAMSGPAGSGQSAAAGAALVTAQSGMSALAGRRSCPDGEIDAMGHNQTDAVQRAAGATRTNVSLHRRRDRTSSTK